MSQNAPRCSSCSKPITEGYVELGGGKKLHPEASTRPRLHTAAGQRRLPIRSNPLPGLQCFKCAGCGKGLSGSFVEYEGLPYHDSCQKERFNPRCHVCGQFLEADDKGQIVFLHEPEWPDQRSCTKHAKDGTQRCACCQRMRSKDAKLAVIDSSGGSDRACCSDCMGCAILHQEDAQPVYEEVVAFLRQLGLDLPADLPIMVVDSASLNAATQQEVGHERLLGSALPGPVSNASLLPCLACRPWWTKRPTWRASVSPRWNWW